MHIRHVDLITFKSEKFQTTVFALNLQNNSKENVGFCGLCWITSRVLRVMAIFINTKTTRMIHSKRRVRREDCWRMIRSGSARWKKQPTHPLFCVDPERERSVEAAQAMEPIPRWYDRRHLAQLSARGGPPIEQHPAASSWQAVQHSNVPDLRHPRVVRQAAIVLQVPET